MILFILFYLTNCWNFNPTDTFIVYHLQAPLFEEKLGDLLKAFNAYHFGIGFHNVGTGEEYTVDYTAKPTVLSSILPKLDTTGVHWDDIAITKFRRGLNRTYWDTIEELYVINGEILNHFMSFVQYYNSTTTSYKLMNVFVESYPKSPIMTSFNCVDFMVKGLTTLVNLGANKSTELDAINIDYPNLYIKDQPKKISYVDNEQRIIGFYTSFMKIFNETVYESKSFQQILADSFSFVQNATNCYIYHYLGDYYTFKVVPPYATFKYEKWVLPV